MKKEIRNKVERLSFYQAEKKYIGCATEEGYLCGDCGDSGPSVRMKQISETSKEDFSDTEIY